MGQMVDFNIRIDEDVKNEMEKACFEIGISMSDAFTIFAKKVGKESKIPFEISADPFYSESNLKHIDSIMKDIKDGKASFSEHDLIEVD